MYRRHDEQATYGQGPETCETVMEMCGFGQRSLAEILACSNGWRMACEWMGA
jgi:hypothetical protein